MWCALRSLDADDDSTWASRSERFVVGSCAAQIGLISSAIDVHQQNKKNAVHIVECWKWESDVWNVSMQLTMHIF